MESNNSVEEFFTTNLFKCSKCAYVTAAVDEIKDHVATCGIISSEVTPTSQKRKIMITGSGAGTSLLALPQHQQAGTSEEGVGSLYHWPKDATSMLLALIREFYTESRSFRGMSQEISNRMQEKGYPVSSSQCDSKWKNMKRMFMKLKRRSDSFGGHAKKSWEFFTEIDDLLKTINGESRSYSPERGSRGEMGERDSSPEFRSSESGTDSEAGPPSKRKRVSVNTQQPRWFKDFRKDCDRRHKERQVTATRLVNILEKFVERINCKCYRKWK